MDRWIHVIVALLLVIMVLAVFISPAVDLPRSTLSAQQAALMVLMSIMFAARRVVFRQTLPLLQRFFAEAFGPWQRSAEFTALTSVLLC